MSDGGPASDGFDGPVHDADADAVTCSSEVTEVPIMVTVDFEGDSLG